MNIDQVLMKSWFEDENGAIVENDGSGAWPEGAMYRHTREPSELTHQIDAQGGPLGAFRFAYNPTLATAIMTVFDKSHDEAAMIAALACARCASALAWRCGYGESFPEYSEEYRNHPARCAFCLTDEEWNGGRRPDSTHTVARSLEPQLTALQADRDPAFAVLPPFDGTPLRTAPAVDPVAAILDELADLISDRRFERRLLDEAARTDRFIDAMAQARSQYLYENPGEAHRDALLELAYQTITRYLETAPE